jgi:simple sugar transport system ATP-binding protein
MEAVLQDLSLTPDLSVVDNIFLSHEVMRTDMLGRGGIIARKRMIVLAEDALRCLGMVLPSLHVPVRDLSGGQRQVIAIAKAVMWARSASLQERLRAHAGID